MNLQFEWDFQKAELNIRKHDVSFEDAKTVFYDPLAYIFNDEWHSTDEQREIIIGHNSRGYLLVVSFTERNRIIRIISARLATNKERKDYEQYQRS
ncbi:BrnT family toxin [Synechocystis sp. LEGE 06083]|uniref:BrnT family toxin n=1 Tax=Synechocystis sp. LEGE 06083 TaxID=915336 RepID=UPI0018823EB9|nr:BrnT family toxin [Synechocystis sp. LEGE 06083]MBE9195562.1 BrnT family toxin [Synechocystis sp. LEGE 06083]